MSPDSSRCIYVSHAFRVDVPHPAADLTEHLQIEPPESNLDRTWVVEPSIVDEIRMQPLGQWRQTMDALRPLEQCRSTRNNKVEPRKAAGVDLVDELTERVERPVSYVSSHSLQRLNFVEYEDKSGAPPVPKECQQPLEERKGTVVVEVALDARRSLDAGGDVRLAGKPRKESVCLRSITVGSGSAIGAEHSRERGRPPVDLGQALLSKHLGGSKEFSSIVLANRAAREYVLLQNEEPSINDGAQSTGWNVGGAEPLAESAIDRFEVV